jgi:hypothetical protein
MKENPSLDQKVDNSKSMWDGEPHSSVDDGQNVLECDALLTGKLLPNF